MNRVESAISEGRCVLAVGGRAIQNPDVLAELRRRHVTAVGLGGTLADPLKSMDAGSLGPVIDQAGGVLVLVEPDAGTDGRALSELAAVLKAGSHKPRIYVAARAFNPFGLPLALRLLKLEQIKSRAADFIASLPIGEPPSAEDKAEKKAKAKARKDKDKILAPRPTHIGREDELAVFGSHLAEAGGPIFVTGPAGIGKRWFVDHALAGQELGRLPDFTFGRGANADSFLARVAILAQIHGDGRLHGALRRSKEPVTPAELAEMALAALSAAGLDTKVWVIHGLDHLYRRRDKTWFRLGRIELALDAILAAQPALKLVFTASSMPACFQEGMGANLRQVALSGLQGQDLHPLYEANRAAEFPREKFGPIAERTHGHPLANRMLAAASRDEDIEALLEQPRYLRAESIEDIEPLRRHLKRKVEELSPELRASLNSVANLQDPGDPEDLQILGVNRVARLSLLAAGLLDQTPHEDHRRYHVHPLIREHLSLREIEDFDLLERLGMHKAAMGLEAKKKDELLEGFALCQAGNRLLTAARRPRNRTQLPYADMDPVVETIRQILGRRTPRLDVARMRLSEASKQQPLHTDLMLIEAELTLAEAKQAKQAKQAKGEKGEKGKKGNKAEAAVAILEKAIEHVPTPEAFLTLAKVHRKHGARGRAVDALERGLAAFASCGRIHRHLASLYLDQNRLDDALASLSTARDLEPQMPDTYGEMGEIKRQMGSEHWEAASELLSEARRLDPTNPAHMASQAALMRDQAFLDAEGRPKLLAEAEELARAAMKANGNDMGLPVLLATLILDQEGDMEQAEWLLKKAMKKSPSPGALVQRARVLIRKKAWADAEVLLDKAAKKAPSMHASFAARGELWDAQGQVFHAFEAWKGAKERSSKSAPERDLYDQHMQRLSALIESGAAADLMKDTGAEGEGVEAKIQAPDEGDGVGPRRDAGTTTIRRKKTTAEGSEAAEAAAPEEAAEVAPTEAAEAAAPEVAVEAAAPEVAVEAAAPEVAAEVAPTEAAEAALPEDAIDTPTEKITGAEAPAEG